MPEWIMNLIEFAVGVAIGAAITIPAYLLIINNKHIKRAAKKKGKDNE